MKTKKYGQKTVLGLFMTVVLVFLGYLFPYEEIEVMSTNETESNGAEKKIAITFDDGPNYIYTEMLLDGLKERGVHATFFLIGEAAKKYPDLVKRMDREGHLIGNHTYHHVSLKNANTFLIGHEVIKTNDEIEKVIGKRPEYLRPPFGEYQDNIETLTEMTCVLWTVDPLDWCCDDAYAIVRRIEENAKDHAIILMHDCYKSSVMAALTAIDDLQKEGYEFVTVDEIIFE